MPGIARLGDLSTYPETSIEASTDTLVNGRGVHRVGDLWSIFNKPLASGSSNVLVNGKSAGRCGDPIESGYYVATCSPDVIIN